jgi:hypothetical protein
MYEPIETFKRKNNYIKVQSTKTLTAAQWVWDVKKRDIPYILESNPHLVFATFLNEKKLVRASNPPLSFNRPLPTGRLFE